MFQTEEPTRAVPSMAYQQQSSCVVIKTFSQDLVPGVQLLESGLKPVERKSQSQVNFSHCFQWDASNCIGASVFSPREWIFGSDHSVFSTTGKRLHHSVKACIFHAKYLRFSSYQFQVQRSFSQRCWNSFSLFDTLSICKLKCKRSLHWVTIASPSATACFLLLQQIFTVPERKHSFFSLLVKDKGEMHMCSCVSISIPFRSRSNSSTFTVLPPCLPPFTLVNSRTGESINIFSMFYFHTREGFCVNLLLEQPFWRRKEQLYQHVEEKDLSLYQFLLWHINIAKSPLCSGDYPFSKGRFMVVEGLSFKIIFPPPSFS